LYDTQGNTQAAIAQYQYAIQIDTQPSELKPQALNNLARAYILAGKSDEAVLLLEGLTRQVHDCAAIGYAVCKNLGWAWHELGNHQWAAIYLQRAADVEPDAGIPHCLLAEIHEEEGEYAQAQASWIACEERLNRDTTGHPDNLRWQLAAAQHLDADYLIAQGHEQIEQGNPVLAALILTEAIKRALETADLYWAHTYLGWAQLLQAQRGETDYSTAMATLRQAAAVDSAEAAAHCLLGETLTAANDAAGDALEAWQESCARADDRSPDEQIWLGKARFVLSAAGRSRAATRTAQP
jgi:tetratricopeptide (TPR) repeat protein